MKPAIRALRRMILCIICGMVISACGTSQSAPFTYRFADRQEGQDLLMSNESYFAGFSENDLQFRARHMDDTIEEYLESARSCVRDFTDEQKNVIDEHMNAIAQKLKENRLRLPAHDEIIFVCTSMAEEPGAAAYTHGTQIYLGWMAVEGIVRNQRHSEDLEFILAHELFHTLTRSDPDFRREMYSLIHFTVQDTEFEIPPSVMEYYISNPDVEHHNASAVFTIHGDPVECFLALVTKKHREREGEMFTDTMTAALVPADGSDVYYDPSDASDWYEVMGKNTGYTIDPEECMADNFAYALVYGIDGPEGKGYQSPEIIEGILEYLKQ